MTAIRNVILMQERMDVLGRKVDRQADDIRQLGEYALAIDKRVVRIEAMIEVSRGRGRTRQHRIAE